MKIFVDSDVLLDVALDREPFNEMSGKLLDYLEANPKSGFIAWHSIANLFYIVEKNDNKAQAISFIVDLCRFVQIPPCTNHDVVIALNLELSDFEDALQCAASLVCQADVLVTRNIDDYENAPLKIMTPTEIVNELAL